MRDEASSTATATRDPFAAVVGQDHAVTVLRAAADGARSTDSGTAMTHAWLITGPPGSGRSTAALAFAAALVGHEPADYADVLAGRHVDVEHATPEAVEYSLEETRSLIESAHLVPMRGGWQVVVVEDADRLSATCANALLKTLEEPPPASVWVLCAPGPDDVLPTIRSRCRTVTLRTLSAGDVVDALTAEGVPHDRAAFTARVAQGHVGRARALATDEVARTRRDEILCLPTQLSSLASCLDAAGALVTSVNADVDHQCGEAEQVESEDLLMAYGKGATGKGVGRAERRASRAVKDLQARHKRRRRRMQRDLLDRAVTDLVSFYRDVLVIQLGAGVEVINVDLADSIAEIAGSSRPTQTMRRLDALSNTRGLLESNVSPVTAFESMALTLADPDRRATAR